MTHLLLFTILEFKREVFRYHLFSHIWWEGGGIRSIEHAFFNIQCCFFTFKKFNENLSWFCLHIFIFLVTTKIFKAIPFSYSVLTFYLIPASIKTKTPGNYSNYKIFLLFKFDFFESVQDGFVLQMIWKSVCKKLWFEMSTNKLNASIHPRLTL